MEYTERIKTMRRAGLKGEKEEDRRRAGSQLLCIIVLLFAFILMSGAFFSVEAAEEEGYFTLSDGVFTYYDGDGKMARSRWISYEGDWYFAGADGGLYRDRMFSWGKNQYYVNSSCYMVCEKRISLDGRDYYFNQAGHLVKSNWVKWGGSWYYAGADGAFLKDCIFTVGGKRYYADADGVIVCGAIVQVDGEYYYATASGAFRRSFGWVRVGDDWYLSDSNGRLCRNSWKKVQGTWYYFDTDARMVKDRIVGSGRTLYYLTASGAMRASEGWFTTGGKEYVSDSTGKLYVSCYVTKNGSKCFVDKTGARIEGKPTIDQYLGCDDLYGWMVSHHSDYYFKTPYVGLNYSTNDPQYLIRPYGVYGSKGGMNCTGFISSLVKSSGGDLSLVSAMGRSGGYGNADNYLLLALNGLVRYETFDSVEELLASGRARKGNIFYLAPEWGTGDCHMAVFWGDSPSDNKIWSQTARTLCTVTKIYMVDPINRIFMFPIEENVGN